VTELAHASTLSTFAEMSIAVVGFSMVAGAIGARSEGERLRLFTFRDVAEVGLICAVMSSVPLVIHAFGTSADSTWRVSSGIEFAWQAVSIGFTAGRRGPALLPFIKRHRVTLTLTTAVAIANFVLLAINVVSPGPYSGARYLACMLLLLLQAGTLFIWAAFGMENGEPAA